VALEVGIVGLPNAGKTTLFNCLTRMGAEITAYASQTDKANVGMATITDPRLDALAEVVKAKKITPAAVRVVDVPGTGPALLGNLRQVDAILAVVDGFSPGATPQDDLVNLELELIIADRDHVERRLERVAKQAKSGDTKMKLEAVELEKLLAHLEAGKTMRDWAGDVPAELEPLTTKPLLVVENGPNGIDCQLELELVGMEPEDAAAFRNEESASALEQIGRRLFEALDLIVFFTAGEKETRAWTLRKGETALDAAETIHSDIAKGFIRAEVYQWDDLVRLGSHTEVTRAGLMRLEGKTYVLQDGDVLNIRHSN